MIAPVSQVYSNPSEFWRQRIGPNEELLWSGTAKPFSHMNALIYLFACLLVVLALWLALFRLPSHYDLTPREVAKRDFYLAALVPFLLLIAVWLVSALSFALSKALHHSYTAWAITDLKVYGASQRRKQSKEISWAHGCEVPTTTVLYKDRWQRLDEWTRAKALYFGSCGRMYLLSGEQVAEIQKVMLTLANSHSAISTDAEVLRISIA